VTDGEALYGLCKLAKDFRGVFSVGYYNTERFHPKMFLFERGRERAAIIGSSNLTGTGLGENVEANLLVVGVENEEVFQTISHYYETIWDGKDVLNEDIVKIYSKRKKGSLKTSKYKLDIPRTKIRPVVTFGADIRTFGDLLAELGKDYFFMMHLSYARARKYSKYQDGSDYGVITQISRSRALRGRLAGRARVKHTHQSWVQGKEHICACA